jgi:hypothetical protein
MSDDPTNQPQPPAPAPLASEPKAILVGTLLVVMLVGAAIYFTWTPKPDAVVGALPIVSATPPAAPPSSGEPPDIGPFLAWVGKNGINPRGALTTKPECYDDLLSAGWCAASATSQNEDPLSVWWFKADPSAFEIEADTPVKGTRELRCEDVGATTVRRWRDIDIGICSHCIVTTGPIEGWHLYIGNKSVGVYVRAFNDKFLQNASRKAADFRNTLETQGVTLQGPH